MDGGPVVIERAHELMFPSTRRRFLQRLLAGGAAVLLPGVFTACNSEGSGDDGNPLGPLPSPVTGLTFDLTSDVGIFRLVHLQEQLEAAFYTLVAASSVFNALSAPEQELFIDLRNTEILHREVVRLALGSNAVPDLRGSIDFTAINDLLTSRETVIATARTLEHVGLAGLNGSAKYISDARNLLMAGKMASVEARHAAALRDVLAPAGVTAATAFAGDDVIDASGRDVKLEAAGVISRDLATGIARSGTLAAQPIVEPPTAAQGQPTADFFPANP